MKINDLKKIFSVVFFVVYGAMLLMHIFGNTPATFALLGTVCAGLAFAVAVHMQRGIVSLVLLLSHMSIEWYVHAKHGAHYTSGDLFFHGAHAFGDVVLLIMEARHHWGKKWLLLFVGVLATIACMVWWLYVPPMPSFSSSGGQILHAHAPSTLHQFILGGMLGCVVMHLFYKKQHPHQPAH